MQRLVMLALIVALIAGTASAAQALQIAGIRLGDNINHYKDLVQMDTALPVRHMEYLTEVELKPTIPGFRTGYITYGNCQNPGQIVKMKLKYERSDKEFFNELLKHFKKRFGEPDQYRGDAFRAFVAWKWSLKDQQNNRISLILQNNSSDVEEYTQGISVKLSATTLLEKECQCYETKHPEARRTPQETTPKVSAPIDFNMLVPN